MAQVSKRRLDPQIESRMFALFWRSLSRFTSSEQAADFFSDLLSQTEKIMLVKRYFIAILLSKNKSYQEICELIKVSPSTINTVAAWLKNLKPATKKIIDQHLRDETWGKFFDKLESILDSIHPMYYTRHNWKEIGKAKFKNSLARSSRSVLR